MDWNASTAGATSGAAPDYAYPMSTHASEYYVSSNRYISGPHSRDYYLLLDEQADYIFAMRLAARIREARDVRNLGAARLLEIWIDDREKQLWYVVSTDT